MEAGSHLAQTFNSLMWEKKTRMEKVIDLISDRAGTRTPSLHFFARVLSLSHEC